MHCIDEHGVPDPSMSQLQVSNSAVLCKLLVRGWTVETVNFEITKYKLTSSDSVAFECKETAGTRNAYTVTISGNKTYVSQTNQKTVTVPFVCLPEKYTDNRTELSKGVIKMQRPSVGGGGSSTSGSVTLDADDFKRSVSAFDTQVQRLSTVINQSFQTTTSAVTAAAAASKVAVEAARESKQNSSSTNNNLAQAVQSLQQNNETTSQEIQSQTKNFLDAMQRMEQSFKQVITQNQQFIDRLVSARTPRKTAHNAAAEAKAAKSDNVSRPLKATAEEIQALQEQLAVRNQRAFSAPVERKSSLASVRDQRDKRASSDPVKPKNLQELLRKQATARKLSVIESSINANRNQFSADDKHNYITHDPFYRRREIGCSHVFIPSSESEWKQKKVCVIVSTFMALDERKHRRLLHNLSTLSMLIVEIFPKSSINNFPRVYVCDYDPTGQYSDVKDLVPANALENPDKGFDCDTVQSIFDDENQNDVFNDCLLNTVPLFSEVSKNINPGQIKLVLRIVKYQDIKKAKTDLKEELQKWGTGLYEQYVQGLLYEIERFEEIQQHVQKHEQTQVHENLRNARYFADHLSNDIKRVYLNKAIKDTIAELEARVVSTSKSTPNSASVDTVPLSNKAIYLTNLFPEGQHIDTLNALVDEFHIMYKLYTILHQSKTSSVTILVPSTMYVMWLCTIVDYKHPKLYDLVKTHFDLLQKGNYDYDSIHAAHVDLLGDSNVEVQGSSTRYPGIYSKYETKFRTQISDQQFEMHKKNLLDTGMHDELLQQKLKQIEPQLKQCRAVLRQRLNNKHLNPPDDDILDEATKDLLINIDAIDTLDGWQMQKQKGDRDAVFYYIQNLLEMPKTDAVVEYISYCLLHLDQTTFFAQ